MWWDTNTHKSQRMDGNTAPLILLLHTYVPLAQQKLKDNPEYNPCYRLTIGGRKKNSGPSSLQGSG